MLGTLLELLVDRFPPPISKLVSKNRENFVPNIRLFHFYAANIIFFNSVSLAFINKYIFLLFFGVKRKKIKWNCLSFTNILSQGCNHFYFGLNVVLYRKLLFSPFLWFWFVPLWRCLSAFGSVPFSLSLSLWLQLVSFSPKLINELY